MLKSANLQTGSHEKIKYVKAYTSANLRTTNITNVQFYNYTKTS